MNNYETVRASGDWPRDVCAAASGTLIVTIGARVRVVDDTGVASELTGKAAALVAIVALEGVAERRRVAAMLWPDSGDAQARNNLRTLMHRVNRRVCLEFLAGSERVAMSDAQVRMVVQDRKVGLAAMEAGAARECELLVDAGVDADEQGAFGAWLQTARQRLRRLQLKNLCDALSEAENDGDAPRAVALCRACVQLDPLTENWHRQLMETLVRHGDRAAALAAFEDLRSLLRTQLGAVPDAQTRALQLRILREHAQGDGLPSSHQIDGTAPASSPPEELPLPTRATPCPLIERDAVLDHISSAFTAAMHVALEGEAGVGKSRLLRHLATPGDGLRQVTISPGGQGEPYAAITQLLHEVRLHRPALVSAFDQAELARLVPLVFPGVHPPEGPLHPPRLHAALRQWASALQASGVRRLLIDDVHYGDAASQGAIAALLASRSTADVTELPLVLSFRSGEISAELENAVLGAQVRGRARRVAVERLSPDGVRRLLLALGMDPGQAPEHFKRTGGNPFFVIELARHELEQGDKGTPADLKALLLSRMRLCSPVAQQLASVAAVAGSDFSVQLAASVMAQSSLALLPAWNELERRGLFAEHGLVHDLMREAALAALPPLIARSLHAQAAAFLEGMGLQGSQVLRHWLAAGDADRALYHAVYQLHAVSAAGLSTLQLELGLLDLMARASDAILLDNLWATAEAGAGMTADFALPDVWPRLKTLLERVKSLPATDSTSAWIAYEEGRQLYHVDRAVRKAAETFSWAVKSLPMRGVIRARFEQMLAFCARVMNGDARDHARRAKLALADLPRHPYLRRLQLGVDFVEAVDISAAEAIVRQSHRMRAARRRGDLAAALEARLQIARSNAYGGSDARAFRHFDIASRASSNGAEGDQQVGNDATLAVVALKAGRFDVALRCIENSKDADFLDERPAFLALIWLRLGDVDLARRHADQVQPEVIQRDFLTLMVHAYVRAELDRANGVDSLSSLHCALAFMRELGVDGVNLGLMSWEIAVHSKTAAERWDQGTTLLADLRRQGASSSRTVRVLMQLAEAAAELGSPACMDFARDAAWMLRRGCTSCNLYVPEGLIRCAEILRPSQPGEAAALVNVARRWVQQALVHVPERARFSFSEVPVNRRLLAR